MLQSDYIYKFERQNGAVRKGVGDRDDRYSTTQQEDDDTFSVCYFVKSLASPQDTMHLKRF